MHCLLFYQPVLLVCLFFCHFFFFFVVLIKDCSLCFLFGVGRRFNFIAFCRLGPLHSTPPHHGMCQPGSPTTQGPKGLAALSYYRQDMFTACPSDAMSTGASKLEARACKKVGLCGSIRIPRSCWGRSFSFLIGKDETFCRKPWRNIQNCFVSCCDTSTQGCSESSVPKMRALNGYGYAQAITNRSVIIIALGGCF